MDLKQPSEPLSIPTRDFQVAPRSLNSVENSSFAKPLLSKNRAPLSAAQIAAAMKISVYESFPAQIFATLTSGVFLPAFALALGASNFHIGALAAIPFFASLFQLAGAFFVEKYGWRKKFCVITSSTQRLGWAPAVILFFLFAPGDKSFVLGILLAFMILTHVLGALSGVAWLSWMTDVVPEGIRGRYFGLRNSVVSIATTLATFAGGWFLDQQQGRLTAFYTLFLVAAAAGAVCTFLISKQPEPPKMRASRQVRFFHLYLEPFKQPNFRRLLRFSIIWQFAFNFVTPFFIVYMLTDLGMSYSLTATFAIVTAVFDLIGMRVWGHVSDHIGNKPVMTIAAVAVTALPWLWLFTGKNAFTFLLLVPLLHIVGGFFWAGYNLCSANILFRLAPRERNTIHFGAWAACNGLAACSSALLGGVFGNWASHHEIDLLIFSLAGLKAVFLISGVLRFIALLFLRPLKEPEGMRTLHAIRVLRSIKSWALMMGDHSAMQFFVPESNTPKSEQERAHEEVLWPLFGRKKRHGKSVP